MTQSIPQTLPEPEAWRIRYRSEPGMIGHYPWSYTGRKPKYVNDASNEVEAVYTEAQVKSLLAALSAHPLVGAIPQPLTCDTLKSHFTPFYLLANCRRICSKEHQQSPNWVIAGELFAVGSTSARKICREAGIDPEAFEIKRNTAPSSEATAAGQGEVK